MGRLTRCSAILGVLGLVAYSTSSHVVVGTVRPPVPPEDVRVYMQPPSKYETIATINATSQGSLALTSQQNMDKAIERMKAEAGKLGANGVLLQGVSDQQTGSIGTGVGSSSYGPSSATGVGVGGSFGLTNKATLGPGDLRAAGCHPARGDAAPADAARPGAAAAARAPPHG